jgi:hypothetical protein
VAEKLPPPPPPTLSTWEGWRARVNESRWVGARASQAREAKPHVRSFGFTSSLHWLCIALVRDLESPPASSSCSGVQQLLAPTEATDGAPAR